MGSPVHSNGKNVETPVPHDTRAARRTPTVRDVATLAGVSVGVASVVLRDAVSTIRVGVETRERVRQVAEQLGYTPNAAARALRTGRTQAVGVVVRQIGHPFFGAIVEGIEAACGAAGYHLLLGDVRRDESEERAVVGLLAEGRADGLLVLGELADDQQAIAALAGHRTPTVLVARPSVERLPAVTLDFAGALRQALDHLRSLGHRAVALPLYVEGRAMPTSQLRIAVGREYATARGWPAIRTFDAEPGDAGGLREWLRAAVAGEPDPRTGHLCPPLTAVVASDRVAIRALKAAQAEGIDVPGDLSIIALDGTELTTFTTPALTTVAQPLHELGLEAGRLLVSLIEGCESGLKKRDGRATGATMTLAPDFVVRDSTGPAPGCHPDDHGNGQ